MDTPTTTETPTVKAPTVTSGDDIAASVAAGMPNVTEGVSGPPPVESEPYVPPTGHHPAGAVVEAEKTKHASAGKLDSAGTPFDPARHKVNLDGTPRQNAKGKWMGFKADFQPSESQKTAAQSRTILPGETVPVDLPDKFELAARAYCKGAEGGLCALISDEWKFDDKAEEDWVVAAVTEYLRSTGETNLSPGTCAILVGVAYAGKRFQRPKTATKFAELWHKVKGWFGGSKS